MIQFDVSSIPADATITSASLKMKVSLNLTTSPMTITAYRITRRWEEDAVSWLDRTASAEWTEKGGDYAATALDTQTEEDVGDWVSWDVTDAVRAWVAGDEPNRGILFRTPENTGKDYGYTDPEGVMFQFHSSEAETVEDRPTLEVTYEGGTVDPDGGVGSDAAVGSDATTGGDGGEGGRDASVVRDSGANGDSGQGGASASDGCGCRQDRGGDHAWFLVALLLIAFLSRKQK